MVLADGRAIDCRWLVVADGARSTLVGYWVDSGIRKRCTGGSAGATFASPRADEPWISSDLELRSAEGQVLPGYGWIFPLGNGG